MFFRYVSHEIRTPLNAVVLGLHYLKKQSELKDNVMDEDDIDVVEEVRMSCDAAIDILNDLLTYEKLDGGLLQTYFKPEPAFDFVLEVTRAFRLQVFLGGPSPFVTRSFCGLYRPVKIMYMGGRFAPLISVELIT